MLSYSTGSWLVRLVLIVGLVTSSCTMPYSPPRFEPISNNGKPLEFAGLVDVLAEHDGLHMLWMHGMCPHDKAWAVEQAQRLARGLGLVVSTPSEARDDLIYRYELSFEGKRII